jgi:hypothetical protein
VQWTMGVVPHCCELALGASVSDVWLHRDCLVTCQTAMQLYCGDISGHAWYRHQDWRHMNMKNPVCTMLHCQNTSDHASTQRVCRQRAVSLTAHLSAPSHRQHRRSLQRRLAVLLDALGMLQVRVAQQDSVRTGA